MLNIGVLVSGGGTNLQAVLDHMEQGIIKNCKIVTVVSSNPEAYALQRAQKYQINNCCINRLQYGEAFIPTLIRHFKEHQVGLILLAGYMTLLPEAFVSAFEGKIMNIHPSLIPSFCGKGFLGLRVHQAVLERGVKITGATVHFVDSGADTGPIIMQKAVAVYEGDSPETLQKRVMEEAEQVIYPQCVKDFAEGKLLIAGNKVRRISE